MVDKIKKLCAERGITINRLEKEVGLGNGTIRSWGKHSPSVFNVEMVALYFGCTVDDLLRKDD